MLAFVKGRVAIDTISAAIFAKASASLTLCAITLTRYSRSPPSRGMLGKSRHVRRLAAKHCETIK